MSQVPLPEEILKECYLRSPGAAWASLSRRMKLSKDEAIDTFVDSTTS